MLQRMFLVAPAAAVVLGLGLVGCGEKREKKVTVQVETDHHRDSDRREVVVEERRDVVVEPRREVIVEEPRVIVVHEAPPAVRVEHRTRSPGRDYIWIDGYWHHDGHRTVWIEGKWTRHDPGKVWVSASWKKTHDGWEYRAGYWKPEHR